MRQTLKTHFTRAAAIVALGTAMAATAQDQSLHLHNLHTGESVDVVYKRDGRYVPLALDQINNVLRDHRRNESTTINPRALDRLYAIGQTAKRHYPGITIKFEIISGYRAAATNDALRAGGGGQAKESQHTHGNAIDFRIPGVPTKTARDIAWCTGSGGVGYYAQDGFVHIDTARTRFWPANWNPGAVDCAKFR